MNKKYIIVCDSPDGGLRYYFTGAIQISISTALYWNKQYPLAKRFNSVGEANVKVKEMGQGCKVIEEVN